jgi:hypothetical protein
MAEQESDPRDAAARDAAGDREAAEPTAADAAAPGVREDGRDAAAPPRTATEPPEPAQDPTAGVAGAEAASLDVEARARDEQRAASDRGRARRVALLGLRVVTGIVGTAAAVIVVAVVGLLPLPSTSVAAPSVTVTPAPAEQLRVCPGALLHLGDDQGQNAGTPSTIGSPQRRVAAEEGEVSSTELPHSDAGTGGTSSAPIALRIGGASGLLAGAQSQTAKTDDERGFAAADCAEPSGSAWLVGGSTATGRTTLLMLANPTQVDATVAIEILGEKGLVTAPGLTGITVAAGSQRVISLAGFAPDLASPVVHVTARGGRIVAALQQTTVRGLDAGGVDIVGATADPATRLRIPGVRVMGADAVAQALGRDDWTDAVPSIRIGNPGTADAKVQVSLQPESAGAKGTSFQLDVAAGKVGEVGLDSGIDTDTGALAIPDGEYSVTVQADQPVVAAARISTASPPSDPDAAPASDFAWDVAAPALQGATMVTIAPGPDPRVAFAGTAGTVTLKGLHGAADVTVTVPANGQGSASVVAGASYRIQGGDGMTASVGYAAAAALASYPIVSPRPVSGPITVHP